MIRITVLPVEILEAQEALRHVERVRKFRPLTGAEISMLLHVQCTLTRLLAGQGKVVLQ